MRNYLFFFFLASFFGRLPAQGPLDGYLKGKKHLDIAASFSNNTASKFEGVAGQIYDASYRGNMLAIFAEYGLTENFDLVGTGAFVFTESQNGLQDGGFYAKYRPWKGKIGTLGKLNVLGGFGISFPLSDYQPTATGALGTKAVSAPARLILQLETPLGFFVNLTGGYNWRLDDLKEADIAVIKKSRPDYQAIKPVGYSTFLAKIGYPTARIYADAWFEWQNTKGGADYVPLLVDLPQAYGVSYKQIGGTIYYSERGQKGVYFSTGYMLNGRNVSHILRLTAGMVWKLAPKKK